MDWIFDGIGTEIISIITGLIVGALGGGAVGYRIGVKRTAKQKQIAGDESEQRQELKVGTPNIGSGSVKLKAAIRQSQKAGNNATQTQIGGIDDVR